MSEEEQVLETAETDSPEVSEVVEVPESTEHEPPPKEWDDETEEEAKALGWKSPDEWAGEKPAGYIDDPRRYLDRAENFRPFKNIKAQLEAREAEIKDHTRKLDHVIEVALKAQRQQHERDLKAVMEQQRAAVEVGDVEAWERLETEKANLTPPEEPKVEPEKPQVDPEAEEYFAKNDWVHNPILREAGMKLINARPDLLAMRPKAQLEAAEAEVKKLYPGYFPKEETKPAIPKVDGGGLGSRAPKGKYEKLPKEAKDAFKKFAAQGLFKDDTEGREDYANSYYEG